jgi:hypothetical protein
VVPRPRLHLIRFHGILAPNPTLRSLVVPKPPAARPAATPSLREHAPRPSLILIVAEVSP